MDLTTERRNAGVKLTDLARSSGVGYRRLYAAELHDGQLQLAGRLPMSSVPLRAGGGTMAEVKTNGAAAP